MAAAQNDTQKRKFRVDDNAIKLLINGQAGSLQKALLEAVANALDAGAAKIKLDVTPTHVTITDDGRGFSSLDEINDFFDNFGFDHSQLDRKVGMFGVGRGQLFHFGKNLWTTHGFTMSVDSRADSSGYDLGVAKKAHKGVKIEIELYQALNFAEMATLETELRRLVKYSTIPVFYNGKEVQKSPQKTKWDHETDDAWFKLEDSYELKIYSQGLFVQSLRASQFGKGGTVVTKLGKPLAQNMARNDLLTTDCPVWKRIKKELTRLSDTHKNKAKKTGTLTEPMRGALAKQAISGNTWEDFEVLNDTALFTLTNGKHVRASHMLKCGFVASGPAHDPGADLLIQRGQAMVLHPNTLHRFGMDSVEDLQDALKKTLKGYLKKYSYHASAQPGIDSITHYKRSRLVMDFVALANKCKFFNTVGELPMRAEVNMTELKSSEYTPEERFAMGLMRSRMLPWLSHIVRTHLAADGEKLPNRWDIESTIKDRRLKLASGDGFLACTDGVSTVWLERKFLRDCLGKGPSGYAALSNVLVHELLHDKDSSSGHDHDHDFFQAYHDITIDGRIADVALNQYRSYLARGGKTALSNIRHMEEAGLFNTDDAASRQRELGQAPTEVEDQEEAVVVAEAAAVAPKRRVKMK